MTSFAILELVAIFLGLVCWPIASGCISETVQTPAERMQEAGEDAARLLAQVRKAADEGQYAIGIRLADSLMRVAPELPESYYEMGLLLIQLHQLEAAGEALRTAVSLDPYHRGAWYQLGHVAFENRMYREAINLYGRQREVIEESPSALSEFYRWTDQKAIPQTWLQIGRAYELLQLPDSAKWAYGKVLAIDSTHAQANSWMAGLLDEEGDLESALKYARRAWTSDRANPEFAYRLGAMLYESGAADDALPLLELVVSAQPWNAGAHYNLGRVLALLGRNQEAQVHLEATDRLQNLDQAIEYARAAVARFPGEPARWRELANLLGRAGRSREQRQIQQIIRALEQYAENETDSTTR